MKAHVNSELEGEQVGAENLGIAYAEALAREQKNQQIFWWGPARAGVGAQTKFSLSTFIKYGGYRKQEAKTPKRKLLEAEYFNRLVSWDCPREGDAQNIPGFSGKSWKASSKQGVD